MFGLSVVLTGISRNLICFPESAFPSQFYVRAGSVPGSDDLLLGRGTAALAQMCSRVSQYRKRKLKLKLSK